MLKKKIFTLIELLIVIAIIAILSSFLLPVLQSARNKAHTIACMGNLKQFTLALAGYQSTFDGWLPGRTEGNGGEYNASGARSWLWCIRDEIGKQEFRKLKCPSHPNRENEISTYCMNAHVGGDLAGKNYAGNTDGSKIYKDSRRTQNPTEIVIFTEKAAGKGFSIWIATGLELGEFHRYMFANASFLDGHTGMVMGNRAPSDGKLYIPLKNLDPR